MTDQCPRCHGQAEGGSFDVSGDIVTQPMTCTECEYEWTDEYEKVLPLDQTFRVLVGVNIEVPEAIDVTAAVVRDALHALMTEAGDTLLMEHVSVADDARVPRGQCFQCCRQIGTFTGYLVVDGHEYHKSCWDRANNS